MRVNTKTGIIAMAALTALTSGCGSVRQMTESAVNRLFVSEALVEREAPVVTATPTPKPQVTGEYIAFIEKKDYRLKLYEPKEGCYTGAYILSDSSINFDIKRFEELVGKQHSMYSYYMSTGDNFPITWLLSCIALSKTPNIILTPQSDRLAETDGELERVAKELGEFYTPMFVQLAPVSSSYDPERYVEFYRRAREIFKIHASNAAFVWTVSSEDVGDCAKYYPGDEYVDWVGLNVHEKIVPGENAYDKDLFSAIDYFYYSYQRSKPIMITELAVSHLSSADYVYRNDLAAEELKRIYNLIAEGYPRIKAVTLMNVNQAGAAGIADDFSITGETELVAGYSKALDNPHFLAELDMASSGDIHRELMRSPFPVLRYNGRLMVSAKTIEYDMGIRGVASYLDKTVIERQDYYDLDSMGSFGIGTGEVDEKKKAVVIGR